MIMNLFYFSNAVKLLYILLVTSCFIKHIYKFLKIHLFQATFSDQNCHIANRCPEYSLLTYTVLTLLLMNISDFYSYYYIFLKVDCFSLVVLFSFKIHVILCLMLIWCYYFMLNAYIDIY